MMDEKGDEIAAVIVEPVAGNMCCVPPVEGFLEALRKETEKHGTVLILTKSCAASVPPSTVPRPAIISTPI